MKTVGAGVRGVPLTSKVIADVRELHDRAVELERETGPLRGRRARQQLREARVAETDLLRVLGFESFAQFAAAINEIDADGGAFVSAFDRVEPGDATDAAPDRIAELEEQLAQARFELRALRDELDARTEIRAEPETSDAGGAVIEAAAAGMLQATEELRRLGELLREEREAIESIGARAQVAAVELLEHARADAQRTRDEAAARADAVLDEARAAAIELTRSASVTVDGLRRLAADGDDAVTP